MCLPGTMSDGNNLSQRYAFALGSGNKEYTGAVNITNAPAGAVSRIKGTPGRVDKV